MMRIKKAFQVLFFCLLVCSVFPVKVDAAIAGEACCVAGSELHDGACIKQGMSLINMQCEAYALFVCYNFATTIPLCQINGGKTATYEKCIKDRTNADDICVYGRNVTLSSQPPYITLFDDTACKWVMDKVNSLVGRSDVLCDPGLVCVDDGSKVGVCSFGGQGTFNLCLQATDANGQKACEDCVTTKGGIWTAIGCLPTAPTLLIPAAITIAIGVAGGVSLLIMLLGVLTITLAAGNPDKVQEGKERITSAIAGLSLIIFSAVLLQVIGVDILKIPGF